MKKRIADLLADLLVKNDITDMFSVVGGGSMFLNDAFGHHDKLQVLFNHHEQACAIAAEGYVRASGKMAAICVTTGPGGINALNGVVGAFQDNYPMLVLSGQVRYPTTVESTGLSLRFMGEQEHPIVKTVENLTKYAVMVKDPTRACYEVEKAISIARSGRRGPTWVDIPLDIQGALVEEDNLPHYEENNHSLSWNPKDFLEELARAQRPVILIGSALRSTGYVKKFRTLAEKLALPVLAATYNADLALPSAPYYYGNFGVIGGRAGNFIVQNADLVIGLGCRMAFRQIGFNFEAFSPNSRRMIVDVDANELKKPTLRIDTPIHADIKTVIDDLLQIDLPKNNRHPWMAYCDTLRKKYPVYLEKFNHSKAVNPYFLGRNIQAALADDAIVVLGNSSIAGHILQLGIQKENQRIINNMNFGSMGYDLPAAIGAAKGTGKTITLITGDGSFMMNLQELQTLVQHKLPVKIFLCCNGGYRAIVRTQKNMFDGRFTGCTAETGISMPNFSKISAAFGLPYFRINDHEETADVISKVYDTDGAVLCEVHQDEEQIIEPRVQSRKLEDGTLLSPVIDDLFPFLSRMEYEKMNFEKFCSS